MIYRWLTEVVKKVLGKEVSLKPVFGGTFCTFSCEDQTVDVTFLKIVINETPLLKPTAVNITYATL